MKQVQIKVVRAFYAKHDHLAKVGDVLMVSEPFARELIAAKKAEPYTAPPEPPAQERKAADARK